MTDFSITVLNPKGKDPEQHFRDFAGEVDPKFHPPVNFHAYAACLSGSFQKDVNHAIEIGKPVLMLIRKNMKTCLKTIKKLKEAGLTVAVSLKETGFHQLNGQLGNAKQLSLFKQILTLADGVVSPTEALVPIYQSLRTNHNSDSALFIPTPYPVNDPRWDFSTSLELRQGIFIGTRELKTASRNHLQSLILITNTAKELNCRIGLINSNGKQLIKVLDTLNFPQEKCLIHTKLGYPDYLRFMSQHRVVFQLDQSMVPGQVAGDCALTRQIAIGGNGSIDSLIFPDFCAKGQDRQNILKTLLFLMKDNDIYKQALRDSAEKAKKFLSFENVAKEIRKFYMSIKKS